MTETLRRRGPLSLLAAAGVAGPILFTAGFLAQPWIRRGEYNAITEAISDLEAGPGGWVQQVNFVVFGLLVIALLVMFVPLGVLTRPNGAVFHPWLGVAQCAVLAIWLLCPVVLAVRLRRLAGATTPTGTMLRGHHAHG